MTYKLVIVTDNVRVLFNSPSTMPLNFLRNKFLGKMDIDPKLTIDFLDEARGPGEKAH